MSWIEEIEIDAAEGKLAEIYAELIEKRGKVSNILKVHSLNPDAMSNHLDLYMTLMFGKSGLSRCEREAIAVVVSASNDCAYCVGHHAEALSKLQRALESLPEDGKVHYQIALTYDALRMPQEARRHYRSARAGSVVPKQDTGQA